MSPHVRRIDSENYVLKKPADRRQVNEFVQLILLRTLIEQSKVKEAVSQTKILQNHFKRTTNNITPMQFALYPHVR